MFKVELKQTCCWNLEFYN